jgi:ribonuclease-3
LNKGPEQFARQLGLNFTNPDLLRLALTHRSAEHANNERLEFLGDSVLGYVIAERLYEKFPEADEGSLSRLRARLVNQTSLAELARKIRLGEYLILGGGELRSGGYRRDSILSDALEAVIGAILKDRGIDFCRQWVLSQFDEAIDTLSPSDGKKDPKTHLQELMQGRGLELPQYTLVTACGLAHAKSFQVECKVALLPTTSLGEGSSRKKAEQEAAQNMLALLHEQLGIKP